MKIKPLALALTTLLLALAPRAARAEEEVSFQFFYDNLSPLGEWVQVGDYGDCWHPNDVDEDWAPYTDGYWSYTDAGWTWVSYEDFGGITYHYGRWVNTDEEGWCWVPDYQWGPAWVSWRNNDEAIGWAPLPPEAHWRESVGISTWCDDTYEIGPSYYTFCPIVDFGAPVIRSVCYPRSRNVFFIGSTVNITNICFNSYHNTVFCGGPNFAYINGHSHHHIPSLKLVWGGDFHHHNGHGWTNARNVGNTLQVYAPKIVNNNTTIINKPKITKVINKTQVNKGWNNLRDQDERQKVRAQIKQQNKGLTADTAPAKPVKAEDLKPVPEKADPKAPSPVAAAGKGRKDRNGDGVPDGRPGNGPGAGKTAGRDQNGDGVPDNKGKGAVIGRDTNGDGIPDNQGGNGKNRNAGKDANGDGIPDGQPGQGPGKNRNVGKDTNGDGIPDGQPGQGPGKNRNVGKDTNGDGIPDGQPGNQPGKVGPGNNPKGPGRDQNGDGIPDHPQGKGGNGAKGPGRDANGDGIPDRSNPPQGGFQPDNKKGGKGQGNGGVVPDRSNDDAQRDAARQQENARKQAEQRQAAIERQREQAERQQQQQAENQRRQAEAQQRAIENQRAAQIQRQQEAARERQKEAQRQQPQNIQPSRPQPQPRPQPQYQPPQRPQQPPQQGGGGGNKGKGNNDDDNNKKKNR